MNTRTLRAAALSAVLLALGTADAAARNPRIPKYLKDLALPHSSGARLTIPAWALEVEKSWTREAEASGARQGPGTFSLPEVLWEKAGRKTRAHSRLRPSSLTGGLRVETSKADATPPPPVREVGIMKRDFSGYKKKSARGLRPVAGIAGGLLGLLAYSVNPIIGIAMVLGSFGTGAGN